MNEFSFVIDENVRHQTVRDFGESACWWGSGLGLTEKTKRVLRLLHTEEGLALNVIRLNIGGSVKDDRSDAPYPADSLARRAPLSPLKEDGSYDLRRDAGMLDIAKYALSLGTIDDFTIFMNTPPSSMTINGLTCGNEPAEKGGFVSNLAPERFGDYARYVADVTQLWLDEGIPVKYVSPINEPQWQWDRNNRQEGCHYSQSEVVDMLHAVIEEFDRRAAKDPRMGRVRISMPETAQWYYPREYAFGLYERMCTDPVLRSHADHFAAHSYGTNAAHKREFAQYADSLGKPFPLHQTEWGPLHADSTHPMEFALELANCMYEDLSILNVPHWTWWTGLAGTSYPSGLIDEEPGGSGLILTKRFFVMKHHSRFIRGYTRVDMAARGREAAADGSAQEIRSAAWDTIAEKKWEPVAASAYVSPDGRRLAVILINNQDGPARVRLEGASASVRRLYLTDAEHDCEDMGEIPDTEGNELPPLSVATAVFERED